MIALPVTTSPMITRSNGVDTIYMYSRLSVAPACACRCAAVILRRNTRRLDRARTAAKPGVPRCRDDRTEETHDPARRDGAPVEGQSQTRRSACLEDRFGRHRPRCGGTRCGGDDRQPRD